MLTAPIFGTLADFGFSRKILIGFGILAWSISSASAYFSVDLGTFLLSRAGVGLGEASFVTITPALLSDFYPPEQRNFVISVLYSAGPIGSALGFVLGGQIGQHFGWRNAFLFTGIPGIGFIFLIICLKDPGKGCWDEDVVEQESWPKALKSLFKNKIYMVNIVATLFITFGLGAIADWLPTYYTRTLPNVQPGDMSLLMGGAIVIGGFCGTALGSFVAEHLQLKTRNAYLATSTIGILTSTLFSCGALFISNIYAIGVLLIIGLTLLFMYQGPSGAVIANCVKPTVRTRAFSFQLLFIHLGDAVSPTFVGWLSDVTNQNMKVAVIPVPVSIFLGGIIFLYGWRFLPEIVINKEKILLEGTPSSSGDSTPTRASIVNNTENTPSDETQLVVE